VRVAESALRGRIDLDRYRGTAGLPEAAQAAECLLRRALGAAEGSAVRYLGSGSAPHERRASSCTHTARFAVSGLGVRVVTLERHEASDPRLTSCGAGTVEAPAGYRLLAITADG